MRLNVLPGDGALTRLECADDLTLLEVDPAGDGLDRLLGPGCYARPVLLSLAGASYIDSAGVGWLVLCHKHFREAGGRLVLHSLSPLVAHVFDVLGLDTVLDVAADEEAARALAGRG
jgi:anti-anti-sigma factor